MGLTRRARARNGNLLEPAEELYVEIQAFRMEAMSLFDVMEARAAVIRQRVRQLQPRQRQDRAA